VISKYDGLSHGRAGDLDAGASRAWRQLRRPSDMVRLSPLSKFGHVTDLPRMSTLLS
jgi:hypothetical protein